MDPTQIGTSVLVEVIANVALKLAAHLLSVAKRSPRKDGSLPSSRWSLPFPRPLAPRTGLVGRDRELRAVREALDDGSRLCILYFYGPAGIGKSRLLEEAASLRSTDRTRNILWTPILDLYDTGLQRRFHLQKQLANLLDPENRYFEGFLDSGNHYEARMNSGIPWSILQTDRTKLDELFWESYQRLSYNYRIVIRFDTAEAVPRESELLQALCQISSTDSASFRWILDQLDRLPNTVLLIAGRDKPDGDPILDHIRSRVHKSTRVEKLEVQGLTYAEARELTVRFLKENQLSNDDLRHVIDDEVLNKIGGVPVLLALTVELIRCNWEFFELLSDEAAHDDIGWDQQVFRRLFDPEDPDGQLFCLLGVARKGLDPSLLHALRPDWSTVECTSLLNELGKFSIVKSRPSSTELFLHDFLYELFDRFPPPKTFVPQEWYRYLYDYYRRIRENLRTDWRTRYQSYSHALYYGLSLSSQHAFEYDYLRQSEWAIKAHQRGLDLLLHDELFRFLKYPPATAEPLNTLIVERDSAVRWIKRHVNWGNAVLAQKIAETILNFAPAHITSEYSLYPQRHSIFDSTQELEARNLFNDADDLFWGSLLTFYGEALLYTGRSESRTIGIINHAISQFGKSPTTPEEPQWLAIRVLGRAWNNCGHHNWIYGHYKSAIGAYRRALDLFVAEGNEDERADTMNNLAYVLAVVGDGDVRRYIDEAIRLREEINHEYPLALSLNTNGLIYALQGQYNEGIHYCHKAHRSFAALGDARGTGLASIALGFNYRKQGERLCAEGGDLDRAVQPYRNAHHYLEEAVAIFDESATRQDLDTFHAIEPLRLWEAYNELGCLHRSWGELLEAQSNRAAADEHWMRARTFLRRAHDLSLRYNWSYQIADTYDDLASVAALRNDWEEAQSWVEAARHAIPQLFQHLGVGEECEEPPSGEAYWLIMAKLHWCQGLWLLEGKATFLHYYGQRVEELRLAPLRELAYAWLYFERFWAESPKTQQRFLPLVQTIRDRYTREEISEVHVQVERATHMSLEGWESVLSL